MNVQNRQGPDQISDSPVEGRVAQDLGKDNRRQDDDSRVQSSIQQLDIPVSPRSSAMREPESAAITSGRGPDLHAVSRCPV